MSHRPVCRFSDGKVRALDLVVCHAVGFPDLHPPYSGICPDLLPAHHMNSVSRNFQHVDRNWCGWYPLWVSSRPGGKSSCLPLSGALSQPLRQREWELPDWWVRWKSGPTPKLVGYLVGGGWGVHCEGKRRQAS